MARQLNSSDFAWSELSDVDGVKAQRPVADLKDVFNGDLGTSLFIRGRTTVHKLLGTINRTYHVRLSTRDVMNAVINDEDTEFTLRVYRYAPKHKGEVKIRIKRVGVKLLLSQAITTTELNGLLIQKLS